VPQRVCRHRQKSRKGQRFCLESAAKLQIFGKFKTTRAVMRVSGWAIVLYTWVVGATLLSGTFAGMFLIG